MSKMTTVDQLGKYLCFSLGPEKFAIPLLFVKEVIANTKTTPIPQSPAHFRGVMDLRGQVISVIDLRLKMKIGKPDITPETSIVILDIDGFFLGAVVDSVDSVSTFESSIISETPIRDSSVNVGSVSGVARTGDSLTLLLDLRKALNIDDVNHLRTSQKAA